MNIDEARVYMAVLWLVYEARDYAADVQRDGVARRCLPSSNLPPEACCEINMRPVWSRVSADADECEYNYRSIINTAFRSHPLSLYPLKQVYKLGVAAARGARGSRDAFEGRKISRM